MTLQYFPPESVEPFLASRAFISLIVGPMGSTKTTAGLMKIAYHAGLMAPCRDGVRRSRAVWVRNSTPMLRDTSIPDFLKWFPDGEAGLYTKTDSKFALRFIGSDKRPVECEVLFRGLDDANDVRRLLSLQASFAIFDEFREIMPDIFEVMQGRLGRYPDSMLVPHRAEWGVDSKGNPVAGCVCDDGTPNKHLWGMSNPPDMDSYWETLLTDPPSNVSCFFQPGGFDERADWLHYLPTDYYANLAEGKTQEWIDVYINAQFGRSLAGQPVHRSFRPDFHVSKQPLQPINAKMWKAGILEAGSYPLLIGCDFGLKPAASIGQLDPRGRLLTFASLATSDMGAQRFIREKLKPLLATKFPGIPQIVIGDPAGQQRAQSDERSVFDIFRREGFRIIAARSNMIATRIGAVDNFLTRQIDGGPAVLFDPQGCKDLIGALRGRYHYEVSKKGDVAPLPKKDMASNVADSFQYLCLHADHGLVGGGKLTAPARKIRPATYCYN
jgi:hypothetical protein